MGRRTVEIYREVLAAAPALTGAAALKAGGVIGRLPNDELAGRIPSAAVEPQSAALISLNHRAELLRD